ncbi:hypothetical protein pEaSNUABM9_00188 [Erwinia phage pEa_SNUABM_9]|nr:hypothetical protein pEaSNUABM9_00188 [Erwinia phage pEa_SNUABM_9]
MSIKEFASAETIPAEYKKIGNVTANGSTVDEVTAELAKAAEAKGGDAFKVIGVSGNNKLHGDAIVYKKD